MLRYTILLLAVTISFSCFVPVDFAQEGDSKKNQDKNIAPESIKGVHSLDVDQLMDKVISRYQKNIIRAPYIAKAQYVEKSKVAGDYQMYTESIGFLVSLGYEYIIPRDNCQQTCVKATVIKLGLIY